MYTSYNVRWDVSRRLMRRLETSQTWFETSRDVSRRLRDVSMPNACMRRLRDVSMPNVCMRRLWDVSCDIFLGSKCFRIFLQWIWLLKFLNFFTMNLAVKFFEFFYNEFGCKKFLNFFYNEFGRKIFRIFFTMNLAVHILSLGCSTILLQFTFAHT